MLRAICIAIAIAIFTPWTASAETKRLMLINSYHAEFPWVIEHNGALRENLPTNLDVSIHYLDAKRLSASEARAKADKLKKSIGNNPPDIVVLTDDFALREIGPYVSSAGIPLVFLGINNNPRFYLGRMHSATGVLERPLMKRSIVYIKDIFEGDLNSCLVLFDASTTSKTTLDYVFKGKTTDRFSKTITDLKLLSTFPQWKQAVLGAAGKYDVIIIGLYHTLVDDQGKHVPADDVIHWTSAHSPVPVFGFWDFSIGKGKAVGGFILAGKPQGVIAATLVKRILNGASPASIQPRTAETGRLMFSWHEVERWNINLPSYFSDMGQPIHFVE